MTCGILLVTHPGVGSSLLEVATRLLRQLPLKAEAFEVPFDADLDAQLPLASAAMRRSLTPSARSFLQRCGGWRAKAACWC